MDTPLQVAWRMGARVCTFFPRSQLSAGLKAQDQYDAIPTARLAMCAGTGRGRAGRGRCYNHLRMEEGGAEGSRWGFQSRRLLETRREFRQGRGGGGGGVGGTGTGGKPQLSSLGGPRAAPPGQGHSFVRTKRLWPGGVGWGGRHGVGSQGLAEVRWNADRERLTEAAGHEASHRHALGPGPGRGRL